MLAQRHSSQLPLGMSDLWCNCAPMTGRLHSVGVCGYCDAMAELDGKGKQPGGGLPNNEHCGGATNYPSVSESLTDSDWASDGTAEEEEEEVARTGCRPVVINGILDTVVASTPTGDRGLGDGRSERGRVELGESNAAERVSNMRGRAGCAVHGRLHDKPSLTLKAPVWVKSMKAGAVNSASPQRGQHPSLRSDTNEMPICWLSLPHGSGSRSDHQPPAHLGQSHRAELVFDMDAAGGAGKPHFVGDEVHMPSREFHTAQSLAFESPELLQACRNRDSIMMERDHLEGEARKRAPASGWKRIRRKLWARVTPQCLRPDLPHGFWVSAAAASSTCMTSSLRRMDSVKHSQPQHDEDVGLAAAASVKGYTRRQQYLVDKIEQSIV